MKLIVVSISRFYDITIAKHHNWYFKTFNTSNLILEERMNESVVTLRDRPIFLRKMIMIIWQMCWWQVWDVGDQFLTLKKSSTSWTIIHDSVSQILKLSPTSLIKMFDGVPSIFSTNVIILSPKAFSIWILSLTSNKVTKITESKNVNKIPETPKCHQNIETSSEQFFYKKTLFRSYLYFCVFSIQKRFFCCTANS